MKKINIIYWICTGLIMALMLVSAVGSFFSNPDGAKMMDQMGYKPYIIHFLAVAKILGIITLLLPGFYRLKEWVYAGFTFDLLGAVYSMIAVGLPPAKWAMIPVFIIILAISYIYFHKKLKAKGVTESAV
jgi:uncharacterized membrane protein YphA (DoxX/SURF4 family)